MEWEPRDERDPLDGERSDSGDHPGEDDDGHDAIPPTEPEHPDGGDIDDDQVDQWEAGNLGAAAGETAVALAMERAVDAVAPGFGWTVKAAWLLAGAIDSAVATDRGAGFDGRVPVAHLPGGLTLDVTVRLCEEDPPPLPRTGLTAGWDSAFMPFSEPLSVDGPDGRHRIEAAVVDDGDATPVSLDAVLARAAERMAATGPRGEQWDADALAFLLPRGHVGLVVVDNAGTPCCPLWFRLPSVDHLGGTRCAVCGGLVFGPVPGDVPCRCRRAGITAAA